MRARRIFVILVLWIVAVAAAAATGLWNRIPAGDTVKAVVAAAVPLLLLWRLYVGIFRALEAVSSGMELVKAQDFNSRLRPVGQKNADELVEIFNNMIFHLKEERLHNLEQENFLSLIISSSPLGIAILDFDDAIHSVNPALKLMLGSKNDSFQGKRFEEIPGEVARAVCETPQGTTRMVRVDAATMLRISRLSFISNGFRRPYVMIESLGNEVMRAEKEAYGKVIRLISHEINNTMAGVRSMLDTAVALMDGEEDMAEALTSCSARCLSLCDFITAYANVVRLPKPNLRPMELNKRIGAMVPFLESLAGSDIMLTFKPADRELNVMADSVLLEQAVVNIVKNSKEALENTPSPRISITLSAAPATIVIADNGAGLSEEAAANIFTPFFSTKKGGQGIGLITIAEILKGHNCRFSLKTIETGITEFRIVF